jgi:hypothetical protein
VLGFEIFGWIRMRPAKQRSACGTGGRCDHWTFLMGHEKMEMAPSSVEIDHQLKFGRKTRCGPGLFEQT